MKEKEYIYIVKQRNEIGRCKIGITNNLERRLSQYNGTGTSKDNQFAYLFAAEVKDAHKVENAVKDNFRRLREVKTAEIYFYNSDLFQEYVDFIKSLAGFIEEIPCKVIDNVKEILVYQSDKKTLRERGITHQKLINLAKKVKNDEFYTRYEDIEKEIVCYDVKIWKNKVVFCNCDDPVDKEDDKRSSAFALFFLKEFNKLKLKKLICTHYSGELDFAGGKAYIFTKDGFEEKKDYPKHFTGSFDDPLSIKILNEEADIVCTNPPFSKTRKYWKLLIESGKKFLIVSNIANAVTTAYIPYFRQGLVRAGYNRIDWFISPKLQETEASGYWYTNLPRELDYHKYLKVVKLADIPAKYQHYDSNGILCADNGYIPSDYHEPLSVSARTILHGITELGFEIIQDKSYRTTTNGKNSFSRCLIQKKKKQKTK